MEDEFDSHCRISKVTLKSTGTVIHVFPQSDRGVSRIRQCMIDGLNKIDEMGEPEMYCGVMVHEGGQLSVAWDYNTEEATKENNWRVLIMALEDAIFAIRSAVHGAPADDY